MRSVQTWQPIQTSDLLEIFFCRNDLFADAAKRERNNKIDEKYEYFKVVSRLKCDKNEMFKMRV